MRSSKYQQLKNPQTLLSKQTLYEQDEEQTAYVVRPWQLSTPHQTVITWIWIFSADIFFSISAFCSCRALTCAAKSTDWWKGNRCLETALICSLHVLMYKWHLHCIQRTSLFHNQVFYCFTVKKTITKSYFVVALWACRRSRLQSLDLFKDKVNLSLSSFITVIAPADIQ